MIRFVLFIAFMTVSLAEAGTPFYDSPFVVRSGATTTIQAVDFDQGSSNDAYYDSTSGNNGSTYRNTNVDIQASSEGGYNVGWIAAGEWLTYTLDIQNLGCYTLSARIASPDQTGLRQLRFEGGGGSLTLEPPYTGGWQVFQNISGNICFTSTGTQVLRVSALTSRFNFKSFQLISQSNGATPYRSVTLPGRIEAEEFDNGGPDVAYSDTTSGNNGNAFRNTDVDIQARYDNALGRNDGYNVGWIAPGEWLQYTVNVGSTNDYTFNFNVASPYSTSAFDILVNGSVVLSNVSVPNTGNYRSWQVITRSGVRLQAGENRIVFRPRTNGFNLDYIEVLAPANSTPSTLRVMQWNVAHGNAGITALTNEMAASGAHVFLLNEVRDFNYRQYEDAMRNLTQRDWYSLYILGNGSDGNLILSSIPFVSTQTGRWRGPNTSSSCYPDRSAARAAIRFNNVLINLFVFHNDVCIDNRNYLIDRLLEFMQPTSNGPQILAGDFNAGDDQESVRRISNTSSGGRFHDAWTYVTGQTGSSESSKTRNWRIDYQFHSRVYTSSVRPTNIWLRNYNYSLSDHRSVVADYVVTP